MTILSNTERSMKPAVATIGCFDGVHLGHQHLIGQVKHEAKRRGMDSLVVTFGEHPLKVIRPGFKPQLINTPDEKIELLEATGVDCIALLAFDKEQSMMSAKDFMQRVLKDIYNVQVLVIGHDHHFGHNREEGFDDYVKHGEEIGIEVVRGEIRSLETEACNKEADSASLIPSSTLVRKSLQTGDVETANKVLGYPYFIEGKVVKGFQNGRKMGFPTANLEVDNEKLIPANGVYVVRVCSMPHLGMLNIGTRPTLDNGNERSIEVNIFDFHKDIYSQTLRVELLKFIREEKRFDNVEQLKLQLEMDEKMCREMGQDRSLA